MIAIKDKVYLQKFINTYYLSHDIIESLRLELRSSLYQKHLILDNFLETNFFNTLKNKIYSSFGERKLFFRQDSPSQHKIDVYGFEDIFFEEVNNFIESEELNSFLSQLIGNVSIEKLTGLKSYEDTGIGLGTFINPVFTNTKKYLILQTFNKNNYIHRHNHYGQEKKRLGNIILYLHHKYSENNGALLEFGYKNQGKIIQYKTILPLPNRLVIMIDDDNFFHRVTPLQGDFHRISLNRLILNEDSI